jgi:hypothetical protein
VARPHASFTSIRGHECTGVVGDAHQAVCRRRLPERAERSTAARAHASASARSSALNAPSSRSKAATAARPARMVSSLRAASAIQPLYVVPCADAAALTAASRSGGIEIDRFFRGDMLETVVRR